MHQVIIDNIERVFPHFPNVVPATHANPGRGMGRQDWKVAQIPPTGLEILRVNFKIIYSIRFDSADAAFGCKNHLLNAGVILDDRINNNNETLLICYFQG